MASEYRFIEFIEIFREGCFQGDFFFCIFVMKHGRRGVGSSFVNWKWQLKVKLPCVECSPGKMIRHIR